MTGLWYFLTCNLITMFLSFPFFLPNPFRYLSLVSFKFMRPLFFLLLLYAHIHMHTHTHVHTYTHIAYSVILLITYMLSELNIWYWMASWCALPLPFPAFPQLPRVLCASLRPQLWIWFHLLSSLLCVI